MTKHKVRWTQEPPTFPGYYWLRPDERCGPVLVEVGLGKVLFHGRTEEIDPSAYKGWQWLKADYDRTGDDCVVELAKRQMEILSEALGCLRMKCALQEKEIERLKVVDAERREALEWWALVERINSDLRNVLADIASGRAPAELAAKALEDGFRYTG